MLRFHDEPVIHENIIAKILFAFCSAKISYHENFGVYGIYIVLSESIYSIIANWSKLEYNSEYYLEYYPWLSQSIPFK